MSKIFTFVFLSLVTSCYSNKRILLFVFLLLVTVSLLAIMLLFSKTFFFIYLFFCFCPMSVFSIWFLLQHSTISLR